MRGLVSWFVAVALACSGEAEEPVPRAAEFRSPAVDEGLATARESLERRGFRAGGEQWRGFLVEHSGAVHEMPMRQASCYVVVASTSEALREVTIVVHDAEGAEVARSEPGVPALRICPARSGTYYLALLGRGAGLFAVEWFRGPSGVELTLAEIVLP